LVLGCVTDHNGTVRTGRTTLSRWELIDYPEGGLFAIDPTDEQVLFSHPQCSTFKRSKDGGTTWTDVGGTIDVGTGRRLVTRFMAIRPNDGSKVWISSFYGRMHYSLGGGTTWDFVKDAAGAPFLVDGSDEVSDGPFTFAFALLWRCRRRFFHCRERCPSERSDQLVHRILQTSRRLVFSRLAWKGPAQWQRDMGRLFWSRSKHVAPAHVLLPAS
jgi:hypothetical protein